MPGSRAPSERPHSTAARLVCLAKGEGGLSRRVIAGQKPTCTAGRGTSWGARIRTWDRGTKTRCLTTWLHPTAGSLSAPGVREEICKGDDREGYDCNDRQEPEDEGEDDYEDRERLRRRGDPGQLTSDIPAHAAARDHVEGKQDHADDEDSPLRQVGRECNEEPFDHGDP